MRWLWLIISVVSGTLGDLFSAKAMTEHGEIETFRAGNMARLLRYVVTHRLILIGVVCNAVSFISLIALLSVAELSFAVPATALGYILKTAVARPYLGEYVGWERWVGAVLIAIGVFLIAR